MLPHVLLYPDRLWFQSRIRKGVENKQDSSLPLEGTMGYLPVLAITAGNDQTE